MEVLVSMTLEPVTLVGPRVRLEPLGQQHAAALEPIALDPRVNHYLAFAITTPAQFAAWMDASLAAGVRGDEVSFAIIDRDSGAVVGTTRYRDVQRVHRCVEIGSTFLDPASWRTAVNTEAKYLMLRHLFDGPGVNCVRAWLKTDLLNLRSQRAIERLGAVREGVLRKHMIVGGGRYRDSVVYSILHDEWPAVQVHLEHKRRARPRATPSP